MRTTEPYTIFPRTFKSGKVIYYYQYRLDNGQRSVPKSTGCTTVASARRFCNQLYRDGKFEKSASLKFDVYTKDFFTTESRYYKWKKANGEHITMETLLAYDKFLRNQLLPYFESYPLSNIKRATVKEWVIWATDKWSPKTVNSAQSVLNIIFKQAIDDEIVEYNPCSNLSFRDIKKKDRDLLSVEEVQKMYHSDKWWNEDMRTIFLIGCITGMRISEIVALTNDDVHENYIDVHHSYSRNFGMGDTKTNINRYIPIPNELKLHSDKPFLFMGTKGKSKLKPLNITSFYDNIQYVYSDCGIDAKSRGLATHTNRNFYNTFLVSENVPEAKIKAVIGHKDSSMTGLYTYWKPEMFTEVYEAQYKLYQLIRGKLCVED